MFLAYCLLLTYHVFTAKFYFYIFIGRKLLLPSPLASPYLNQMPHPITLTAIPPGENGPLVFQEIGWDEEEDPLHYLIWPKVKTKHHFQSVDLVSVELKVEINGLWQCGLARP